MHSSWTSGNNDKEMEMETTLSTMNISLGWKVNSETVLQPNSLQEILFQAKMAGYSFICVPPQVRSEVEPFDFDNLKSLMKWQKNLLAWSDRSLQDSRDWSNRILFEISLHDVNLKGLLNYAAHLTVFAVLIGSDWTVEEVLNLYNNLYHEAFPFKFYLKCPFMEWDKWRSLCLKISDASFFGVIPELTSSSVDRFHLDIWPVEAGFKGIIIKESVFQRNPSGYPVLPRHIQRFLLDSFPLPIILEVKDMEDSSCYLKWLLKQSVMKTNDQHLCGYENVLQTPLQPLRDHLPSETYEVFEQDPIKYQLYEEAIEAAIKDLRMTVRDDELRIGVFGAGRGPLVQAVLNAFERQGNGIKLKVFALEKNPNACLTLLDRFRTFPQVEIILADMRAVPESVVGDLDIIVSELLGSFGDNELAPECLRSVVNLLKSDGIMIPQEYTSYIEPCYAPILRDQAKLSMGFDYGYVVHVTKAFRPFKAPLPVFTFHHPGNDKDLDTELHVNLSFSEATYDTSVPIDGLLGYFDCVLYGRVRMSTVPQRASPGMLSWFPIYFPLSEEVEVVNCFSVDFWRKRGRQQVWYEWGGGGGPIQNQSGSSYSIQF